MNLIKEVNKIKAIFDFKNYNLLHEFNKLPNTWKGYKNSLEITRENHPERVKAKLLKSFNHLKKSVHHFNIANQILNKEDLPYYAVINQNYYDDLYSCFTNIENDLEKIQKISKNLFIEIKHAGRPKSAVQEFIIFHLLRMYVHGTKKPISYGFDKTTLKVSGKTFMFIISAKPILFEISPVLKLTTNNKYIEDIIVKLVNKFKDFSKHPRYLKK